MKTIKIRIAVVVNEHGKWNAIGFYKFDDKSSAECAREGFEECGLNEITHYIEADIPVPESQTIQGYVAWF